MGSLFSLWQFVACCKYMDLLLVLIAEFLKQSVINTITMTE